MTFDSALRELGQKQARINAELRRKGDLPPLPTVTVLRAAIRSKCVECVGGLGEGARDTVRECTCGPDSRAPCPLWTYRPWQ
jgi:hypothetical protein